jgi:site-specific DNA-adenine methylase
VTKRAKRKKKATKQKRLLSPFRYPGGKSWLKQIIQQWLTPPVTHLVEAFAGGANVTIAALEANCISRATLIEIDPDISAVWSTVLNGEVSWLSRKIRDFRVTRKNVTKELERAMPALLLISRRANTERKKDGRKKNEDSNENLAFTQGQPDLHSSILNEIKFQDW